MAEKPSDDPTADCRDKIVKRMLATPPQPHTKKGRDPKKAAPKGD